MKAQQTASNMLAKFGKVVTLSRRFEGVYDPATGELSSGAVIDLSVKALVKDYKPNEFISGVIESGDKQVTIASLGIAAPKLGDTVTIDAVNYNVVAVGLTADALYKLQVRL